LTESTELDLDSKLQLLMEIPLLARIGRSNIAHLASTSDIVHFDPGQTLFRQGDTGKEAYIIISGQAEIVSEGPDGDISVATISRHQFIGEIALLIDVPRTATVVATEELTALVVAKEMFYHMVVEYPAVGMEVMRELADRLLKTTTRLREATGDLDTVHLSG
jgi:CRP/FNR family transcriptional regulator, cyclic AMP receptor protein